MPPDVPGRSCPHPALELVEAHPAAAFGLHLDRDEAAVFEAGPPDGDAAAAKLGPGADVRGEGSHPPPRVDRVGKVELAVGGTDLLGIGRTVVGLRREPGLWE